MKGAMPRIIDLTMPTRRGHWRWFAEVVTKATIAEGQCFNHSYMNLDLHGFTHADAPNHYLDRQQDISRVPLDRYYGEARVVDCTTVGEAGGVTADLLEKRSPDVRAGDIVLLRTDWPRQCETNSMDFWGKAPYTDPTACEWLIQRRVKLVGYDYPPDYPSRYQVTDPARLAVARREEYTTHDLFFPQNIGVVEYLTNLHLISRERVEFIAFPIPFEGADGSPVRAVAIER
jgi:arylformamidase